MSYIYYKIPYEGKLQKIKELIRDRDWNLQMKIPEEGILLVKITKNIDEELSFNQGMIIDEETNTKFGNFQLIEEDEFEEGKNISLDNIINERDEQGKSTNQSKKNQNMEYKRQMSEILLNEETLEREIPKNNKYNFISKLCIPKIDLDKLNKKIKRDYRDPYDYFFSKNYLINCFILSIICLVLFNF